MTALLTAIFVLLGLAVGSFLNVCIDRLPARRSLSYPPSHCDSCQRRLTVLDLIPLFSYLWLRGRCRYCGASIPRRVILVEAISGLLFFLFFWRFVASPDSGYEANYAVFAIGVLWSCVFLVIIFIDWEHQLILNRVTYPAAVAAMVILAIDTIFPEAGILANLKFVPSTSILSGLIGGLSGFLFFFIIVLITPRGMGMGDVKLAALIGLVTGFPFVVVSLLIGIIIGGIVAVILLVFRLKGRKDAIPYGTFLGIGPIVTLLWGHHIFNWYIGLM
jgi:leader peptidase (prepilin peptidase) / N-methyltransferase